MLKFLMKELTEKDESAAEGGRILRHLTKETAERESASEGADTDHEMAEELQKLGTFWKEEVDLKEKLKIVKQ